MKTALYALGILVLSFVSIKVIIPKEYPPKHVKEQRVEIDLQERKLDNLINKIEHKLEVDSLELASLKIGKNEQSKTN